MPRSAKRFWIVSSARAFCGASGSVSGSFLSFPSQHTVLSNMNSTSFSVFQPSLVSAAFTGNTAVPPVALVPMTFPFRSSTVLIGPSFSTAREVK